MRGNKTQFWLKFFETDAQKRVSKISFRRKKIANVKMFIIFWDASDNLLERLKNAPILDLFEYHLLSVKFQLTHLLFNWYFAMMVNLINYKKHQV